MDIDTFWQEYEKALSSSGMDERAIKCVRKRVEYFIDSTRRIRLRDKTPEDIRGYLCKQVASGRLEDWQYEQFVDALRVLFVELARAHWAGEFPWEKWKTPQLHFASGIDYYANPSADLHASSPAEVC